MSSKEMEMKALEHDISEANAETLVEVAKEIIGEATPICQKIEDGVVAGYKKIEDGVVAGYKKIEDSVVAGYKKLETGVVEGFGKVTDACVKTLFAKEGESVEDAKARLSGEGKE